jgi:hypothetical protein
MSRRMRWVGHIESVGKMRNATKMLVAKPEGKRPTHRWVDNIKMDLGSV